MSLWARFKAWWEAGQAGRQRDKAEAILAGTATLGAHGTHMGGHYESGGAYGPSGPDCGPGVSGDCTGTGV
jgi:hypothetical protein